jgi:hypothetical protein
MSGMTEANETSHEGINTYNEKALHAAIKQWYAQPGDRLEVPLDGYFIDLIHGDLLVEIQTGSFGQIRRKLADLCARYPVRLVYPIPAEKWIVMLAQDGSGAASRRKSPRRGKIEDLFREVVYLPALMKEENFSLEVLLIQEEEVRRPEDRKRRWRSKGWVTQERRLVQVLDRRIFQTPADLGVLLPDTLVEPFTTRELAKTARQPVWLAHKIVYSLRAMGVLVAAGKRGRSILYVRST